MTSEQPASHDQQNTRGQEAKVVGGLMACTFADVVQAENLMVGETLYEVERPQPTSIHPKNARPLIAHRQLVVRRHRSQMPTAIATHVAA
jgi:hypothetical protein